MISTKENFTTTDLGPLCKRTLMIHNESLMMVRFDFKKGGVGEPHSHADHEQIGYILEGTFELICGDTKTIVTAGDTYLAEKDEVHGVVALEDGAILDVFTPRREEFK